MADKETTMVLKVDLQCCKCYKKIKKLLAKFPEITKTPDYDCKDNKVTIKVKTDNPEKFLDKLLCKGWKIIISIDIEEEEKKKKEEEEKKKKEEEEKKKKEEEEKKKKKEEEEKKKKEEEEKKKKKPDPSPPEVVIKANICLVCGRPSCGVWGGGLCDHGCKRPGRCNEKCCGSCSWGCGGGTCCKGCGGSVPCVEQCCVPCYQGCGRSEPCYGHGYVCGCGCGGRGYCARGCSYIAHENSQGCTMM